MERVIYDRDILTRRDIAMRERVTAVLPSPETEENGQSQEYVTPESTENEHTLRSPEVPFEGRTDGSEPVNPPKGIILNIIWTLATFLERTASEPMRTFERRGSLAERRHRGEDLPARHTLERALLATAANILLPFLRLLLPTTYKTKLKELHQRISNG